ncbi:MAG: transposase zinc-binding domain-containing protein [Candidatus Thiodiazotropha sp. (ex Monitilora ramsayi)]|nr:transposase zinc-binding domain-containing protein [Candidatus Thiodiazotropha sp. (ex Monitilora ramsayi)]
MHAIQETRLPNTFSCKTRYLCPTCHQKRMLAYGDWIEEEVLFPAPHQQYVLTIPKLLRPHIYQRHRLGSFYRIASKLLNNAYGEAAPWGRPGFILPVAIAGILPYHLAPANALRNIAICILTGISLMIFILLDLVQ